MRVVVFSGFVNARRIAEAIAAGAAGFVGKGESFLELAAAVRTAARGGTYVSPMCVRSMGPPAAERGADMLTPRERDVLQLLAAGFATKEVAARLSISVKTAECHRHKLLDKLGVGGVAGLTRYAMQEGITSLDA